MKDMTKGNPLRIILAFAFPLLLTNVCQQCYRIADAAVVGRFLGETALSSVGGASEPLLFMTISFFLGISYGLPIVTGQCFGAKDYVNVRRSIALSLVIACGLSLPLMIAAGFTTDQALHLMKTPEKLMEGASYYMKILYFCGVINVLLLLMTAIIRVLGDSKTPLYLMICSCVLNIGLNILFVAGFGWGIPGVAWATVTAQFVPCIVCVIYFRKKMAQFFPHLSDFRWTWHFIREHLRVALPSGFQTVLVAAGALIVQYAVNKCGQAAVGGISATAPLNNMFFMPLFAMGGAISTFVAQNFGAQNLRRIILGVRKAATLILSYTAIATVVIFLCAPFFATLFLGDTPENQEVIAHGIRFLRLQAPFFLILGCLFCTSTPLTGMGYTHIVFLSGVLELVMRSLGAIVLTRYIGFNGACLSHPLAWIGASCVTGWYYFRKIRELKRNGIPVRIERATEL